ncbi:unnamed protein product [Strongylus vulgaris]|uniref:Uncharacterized protein n=1 Tax=Strongylus vulgaris TaxID=40348 RepID=A0A3P7IXR7_STRVU|nr:unnamed protein product [Strongylus vulgaris]
MVRLVFTRGINPDGRCPTPPKRVKHDVNSIILQTFNNMVSEVSGIRPYWFIVFELAYLALFVIASVLIHLLGLLKTDEDVVTIHHKIHKEVIAQQERRFILQKKVSL